MDNRFKLLRLMADGQFHSGEELGTNLNISRSAVWKLVHSLEKFGLDVYSVKGKGYRLSKGFELLEKQKLIANISPAQLKKRITLRTFNEINSTNQYLLERSIEEDISGTIVLGEYQSEGRGRRGSHWLSPFGAGLNLSIGWRFDNPVDSLTLLSMTAAVAVIHTLNRLDIPGAGVKWPNDIYCQGRKLGGILIEMRGESAGPCVVVIGVGINIALPDSVISSANQVWIDLASIKSPTPSKNTLAAILISELVQFLDSYNQETVNNILNVWRQHDCFKDKIVTLTLPNKSVRGCVSGIDDNGALLLSVNNKIQKFTAGEIKTGPRE